MENKHLIIRAKSPVQIDGVIREGDDILAHVITSVDLQTLVSMVRYKQVSISEVKAVSQSDPEAGSGEGSGETDSPGSTTGEAGAGPSLSLVPEVPEVEPEQKTEQPQSNASDQVAYYVANGIQEQAAEALAAAVNNKSTKDYELLKTIEGIRRWVANGNDLIDLPDIGRLRKASIEKAIAG